MGAVDKDRRRRGDVRQMPGDGHRVRVVAAESRRLERRLREIGPMPLDQLKKDCGSWRWREGTFEEALREGIHAGRLRALPLGWVEATRDSG